MINRCTNISQGGGSTFGVLTSITLKVYKTPKILASSWLVGTSSEAPFKHDLLAYILSQFPSLADAGLSGYTSLSPKAPNPAPSPGAPAEVAGIQGIFVAQDVQDPEYIHKLFKPINETLQKRWPGMVQFTASNEKYSSFLKWYDVYYDTGAAGETNYLVSRLLTKDSLEKDEKALGYAVEQGSIPSGGMIAHLVAGKGVRDARPRGGSASVNPGWRKSYVHIREYLPSLTLLKLLTMVFRSRWPNLRALQPNRRSSGYRELDQNLAAIPQTLA